MSKINTILAQNNCRSVRNGFVEFIPYTLRGIAHTLDCGGELPPDLKEFLKEYLYSIPLPGETPSKKRKKTKSFSSFAKAYELARDVDAILQDPQNTLPREAIFKQFAEQGRGSLDLIRKRYYEIQRAQKRETV